MTRDWPAGIGGVGDDPRMGGEIAPPEIGGQQRLRQGAGGMGHHRLMADHRSRRLAPPGRLALLPFGLARCHDIDLDRGMAMGRVMDAGSQHQNAQRQHIARHQPARAREHGIAVVLEEIGARRGGDVVGVLHPAERRPQPRQGRQQRPIPGALGGDHLVPEAADREPAGRRPGGCQVERPDGSGEIRRQQWRQGTGERAEMTIDQHPANLLESAAGGTK